MRYNIILVTQSLVPLVTSFLPRLPSHPTLQRLYSESDPNEEFDDDGIFSALQNKQNDLSGCQNRQFRLGYDLILSDFAGSMGFDQITDWDYFDNPGDEDRNIVEPPPFDPMTPKRTRSSSGSVVRIFRAELRGRVGATLRAQGADYRVIVKEFEGALALDLARTEMTMITKLQASLLEESYSEYNNDWATAASSRYVLGQTTGETREDDANLIKLLSFLSKSPFVGVLGTLNLDEYFADPNMDPNEWYRALKVPPPRKDSIYMVYEYAGLSTCEKYSEPPLLRIAKLPPKRGFFGGPIPPSPLPAWKIRANYLVNGVLKRSLEALAVLHENGIAHRSIGRASIIMASTRSDKTEASSPYATNCNELVIKMSDFGFAGLIADAGSDDDFKARARGFGFGGVKEGSIDATSFAMAEDVHALGFVFLGMLLSTLANVRTVNYALPKLDEDSLQRLLAEIFKKDIKEFRNYCEDEEAFAYVVALLDEDDGAGWELLNDMCFAREDAAKKKGSLSFRTARGLLGSRFLV